jgi:hypothetical protein
MARGLEITYTKPSTDVQWWPDYLEAQGSDFDAIRASHQRVIDIVKPEGTSIIKRRVLPLDPSKPLERKVQWSLSELPANITVDQAILYQRKLLKTLVFDVINDAPYTEPAEFSFDGIPRTHPRCLYGEWRRGYDETNGIVPVTHEIKELDF